MSQQLPDSQQNESALPLLDPLEARILGCLMEKQRTVPDSYPMTLNALVQACNQKTSRLPVMHLEQGVVGRTVNQLRDRGLIHASFSTRAERYDHKMASSYQLDRSQQALLCVLMLRGPQTLGELRTNAGRLAEYTDLQAVENCLLDLLERKPPLVVSLSRLPGKREGRYAHLLCGEVAQDAPQEALASAADTPGRDRVLELESEVARLRSELDALWELTGLQPKRPVSGSLKE